MSTCNRRRFLKTTAAGLASAVAMEAGAVAKADYKDGMAVFVMTDKGLMVDASIGGQKFNFQPLGAVPPTAEAPGTTVRSGEAGTATVQPSSATTRTASEWSMTKATSL